MRILVTKRFITHYVTANFLLLALTSGAFAGAGIRTVFKGSPASADIPALVASRDFIVFGDGTGPSKIKAARTASPTTPLAIYVKAGGVRQSDAEWLDAQPLLWRSATGAAYTQTQNGWSFSDLQRFPNQWAAAVAIPHIRAQLTPEIDWIFVDNVLYQDPSLFAPNAPPDYDARSYHDATLTVLLRIREAFPDRKLIVNGWQGGAPAGLRGEALGSTSPRYVEGVWFECWYAKCSGKRPTDARFAQDQAGLMGLTQAGLVTVVDEAGLAPYSPLWREAFGVRLATTGRGGEWGNAYFNLSAGPFEGWAR